MRPLDGVGLAPAQLTISPASHNYGSQSIAGGGSSPFSFVVANIGDIATGTTSLPLLGGPDASQFEVAGNTCGAVINPGASCTMSVRFVPKTTGTFNATVSQNPVGVPGVTATLQGTGSLF